MTLLEICVDEPASIAAAVAGGADRLEVCAGLELGGLTPSPALVAHACLAAGDDVVVHALIRQRGGDFVYDDADVDLAIDEAIALLAAGARGLAYGATRDGTLDDAALARWIRAVRSVSPEVVLTLHRAVDATRDPVAAVAIARSLGFDRVLTSGGAANAPAGASTIAAMVRAAAGGPVVMAGAGIRPGNVAALVAATRVLEVHASASTSTAPGDERAATLGFGDPPRRIADLGVVHAIRAALERPPSWDNPPAAP